MTETTDCNEHQLSTKFNCKCGFSTDFRQILDYHLEHPKREITFERIKRLIK